MGACVGCEGVRACVRACVRGGVQCAVAAAWARAQQASWGGASRRRHHARRHNALDSSASTIQPCTSRASMASERSGRYASTVPMSASSGSGSCAVRCLASLMTDETALSVGPSFSALRAPGAWMTAASRVRMAGTKGASASPPCTPHTPAPYSAAWRSTGFLAPIASSMCGTKAGTSACARGPACSIRSSSWHTAAARSTASTSLVSATHSVITVRHLTPKWNLLRTLRHLISLPRNLLISKPRHGLKMPVR